MKIIFQEMMYIFLFVVLMLKIGASIQYKPFPIAELFGFDDRKFPALVHKITSSHLCVDRTSSAERCCSCEASCLKFRTCCVNYFWEDRDWSHLNVYLDYFTRKLSPYKQTICSPIASKTNGKSEIQYVYMVTECKGSKLTISSGVFPVLGDGYVYMNAEVARCHNVTHVALLNISTSCGTIEKYGEGFPVFSDCNSHVSLTDQRHVQSCFPTSKQCPSSSPVARLCRSYQGSVSHAAKLYRNINCLKCERGNVSEFTIPACTNPPQQTFKAMRYSIIVSYQRKEVIIDENGKRVVLKVSCHEGELFDFASGKCFTFQCSPGYIFNGHMCVQREKGTNSSSGIGELDSLDTRLEKCLFTKSFRGSSLLVNFTKDEIFAALKKVSSNYEILQSDLISTIARFAVDNVNKLHEFKKVLGLFSNISASYDASVSSERNFVISRLHGLNVNKMFPDSKQCGAPVVHDMKTIWLEQDCRLVINNTSTPPSDFIVWKRYFWNKTILQNTFFVATCDAYHMSSSCPIKIIPEGVYEVHSNYSVSVETGNFKGSYNISEYVPLKDGIGVCFGDYSAARSSKMKWQYTTEKVEEYITMVGSLVSILCYILVIFSYLYIKELRTVPGLNIALLCIMLLASDLLIFSTIFARVGSLSCHVVSVLLHWSLLVVQAWTAIISYEIFMTLLKATSTQHGRSLKRFAVYFVIAFSVPTVLVVFSNVLDAMSVVYIGYGLHYGCWIASFMGRLLLYILPMVVITCFNIFVLVKTLRTVYKQQRIASQLLKKSDNSDDAEVVKTALKLFVLLGIIEIVGLIQLPEDGNRTNAVVNAIVRLLFTLLRSFRGLFTWLLYVYMNKRVWTHYKCFSKSYSLRDSPTLATKTTRVPSLKNNLWVREAKM